MPTVIVDVGFSSPGTSDYLHIGDTVRGLLDTGTLAPDDILVDISDWVQQFTTRRGSNRVEGPVVRYEAGTSSTTLDNRDRRFDPTNLDGPYVAAEVSQITPMRVVRHRATWDGVTYPLWRGSADSWLLGYNSALTVGTVELSATDGFKVLESYDREADAPIGSGEDSGARVTRILNSVDWETLDRMVNVGDTLLQATTLEDTALSELQSVVETEIGEGYIDAQGRYVFRNRTAVFEDTRSNTSQATFGDGDGELPYDDVTIEYDDEQLFNLVRITREGGSTQTQQDTISQAQYLVHVYDRSGLLMQDDAAADDYAGYILAQSRDPELRFATITINPRRDPDNLFPQVLGREIGDRITVRLRPPGGGDMIEREVWIRGIQHAATPSSWQTVWTLQSAVEGQFLVLDHTTLGKLDQNALAF